MTWACFLTSPPSLSRRFKYQLVVYPGMEINASSVPILTIEAESPPMIVNPDQFGEGGIGKVYTMAIRLRTKRVSVALERIWL